MKKVKKSLMLGLIFIVVFVISGFLIYNLNPSLGANLDSEKKQQLSISTNHNGNRFLNPIITKMIAPRWETLKEFLKKGVNKKPNLPIKTKRIDAIKFEQETDSSEIQFIWFGHSSVLLKIEGKNLLIDPVFSKRASMFSWMGPKRFNYENHMFVNDLPKIDAVLITHDHYDHLDYSVIKELKNKVKQFYVPLGLRVHLEKWGVPSKNIIDLDWWDEVAFNENLKIVLTPSRHFTGRGLTNRMSTLWGGFVILGNQQKIYFSGDSGYFNGFKEIGDKFGPFDLAFIECGQYHQDWEAIHMLPKQSAQAAEDVKAKFVVPIHWGKFKLSLHSWVEPIEMFLQEAKNYSFKTIAPKPNEINSLSETQLVSYWWR